MVQSVEYSITESTVRTIHKSYSFTMQYLSRLCRTLQVLCIDLKKIAILNMLVLCIKPFDQICLLYYYNALEQVYKEAYIGL